MHPYFDLERPIVIGHRGAAGIRPENTLPSFEQALADGAQILESDVHVTRDGVPVLLHDSELDRTTDGRGRVADLDATDLRQLDAGWRFEDESGGHPYRGRGVHVPTLEEAFIRLPDARFNLEIKAGDPRAIAATLELVERFDRAPTTLVTAGDDAIMKALRKALATSTIRPAVGASTGEIVAVVRSLASGGAPPEGIMALQIPPSFMGRPLATAELVAAAHAHGIEVHVWTIDDLDEIAALVALGVDGIVTDHPGRMARWLGRVG